MKIMSNVKKLSPISHWYNGKVALITGATSGIGREIVKQLAHYNAKVLLCGRNDLAMHECVDELRTISPSSLLEYFLIDLSVVGARSEWIARIQKAYQVDILVNNAGFGEINDFCNMQDKVIHSMQEVNITAVVELCRAFLPIMKKQPGTGILNVGSVASFFATPGSALYGATKHFILGMTDAIHQEMLAYGVHVTGLYPGNTRSRFMERSTHGKRISSEGFMSPAEVAKSGLEGLANNQVRVIPGFSNRMKVHVSRILPLSFLLKNIYHSNLNFYPDISD